MNGPQQNTIHLNLALAAMDVEPPDLALASRELGLVDEGQLGRDVELELWYQLAWGRLHLLRGDPARAYHVADDALTTARSGYPTHELLALDVIAQAQALALAQGQPLHMATDLDPAAEEARIADDLISQISFSLGGSSFSNTVSRPTQHLVQAALGRGDADAALSIIRQMNARYLRSLELRARIQRLEDEGTGDDAGLVRQLAEKTVRRQELARGLSKAAMDQRKSLHAQIDALDADVKALLSATLPQSLSDFEPRTPGEGELILTYYQVGPQWYGFASRRGEPVRAVALAGDPLPEALSDEQRSSVLLEPFASQIRAAEQVSLIVTGSLRRPAAGRPDDRRVDLHALPFDGSRLGLVRPVSYLVDVGAAVPTDRAPRGAEGIIADTDPRRPLPLAREEGRQLLGVYPDARLLGGTSATYASTMDLLKEVDLLFFAVHGQYQDGLGSQLTLAEGQSLRAIDVLLVEAAPREVVLTACDSANEKPGIDEGLGMAEAFLAAGSDEVIASIRPVEDELGLAFSPAYARHLQAHPDDPEQAWLLALREIGGTQGCIAPAGGAAAGARPCRSDWADLRRIIH